tara:strand:- start:1133 stop:1366 length:234 start_codon:yes stop_codon:yes gene_type:complete
MRTKNMQQKELKELNDNNCVTTVMAVGSGGNWLVAVDEGEYGLATIRTARGGKREFKTLDAVYKMLEEVGIKSFSVC